MHLSRLEFTGHGDMSTGNLKNGAGETMMEMFQYCGAADEIYDRFCNPKIKVNIEINEFWLHTSVSRIVRLVWA